jgi:hydrogenase nickel incorporation protein HypA/HybF
MHELGIAESILDAVRKELAGHRGARPLRIGLRIGEFAAVDADSLRFCFEAVNRGTDWEPVVLDIAPAPGRDDLDLTYLEVETNESASSAENESPQ